MNRPKYRRRSIRSILLGGRCLDLGGDHRDTVLLAGSARSGTTHVSHLIDPHDEMRYIFEPFHPGKVPAFHGLPRRPYLRPSGSHPDYASPVEAALSGRLRSGWSDRHNRKAVSRCRIVKEVRANLMLGWLRERFPGMKIVFLLRHPCAVVESRLRLGWCAGLEDFIAQDDLLEDYPEPLGRLLPFAKNDFERGVLAWCAENYVPLSQMRESGTKDVHVLRYEDLLLRPGGELESMSGFLRGGTGHLSESASKIGSRPREDLVFGWRERVDENLQERAFGTISAFGLDALYGEDALPKPGGIEKILSVTS